MQATNQFITTNASGEVAITTLIHRIRISQHNWTIQMGDSYFGVMQFIGDSHSYVAFGTRPIELPLTAPALAWSAAGVSALIIVLALALRARWRRNHSRTLT